MVQVKYFFVHRFEERRQFLQIKFQHKGFVFFVSILVRIIMKSTMGIRLSKGAEIKGTDVSEVGVIAYAIRD